ncbi:MAG: alpha/beta hydrolase [Wujia sp.]
MKIAVFFPGIGYHCDKPLLYYARKLAQEFGYEKIVSLSYSYDGGNIRGNEKKMQQAFEVLYAQAEKSLAEIDFEQYSDILFVSKSVGTIIASAYAEKYAVKCRQVLFTPLAQTFEFDHEDAIAFIGTKDPWSDVGQVRALAKEQGMPMPVYDEANHSLETEETLKNLVILRDVMEGVSEFLSVGESQMLSTDKIE